MTVTPSVSEASGGTGASQKVKQYYVYIATSRNRILYTGVTNNLMRRHSEHATAQSKFRAKYNVTRIVYCETYTDVRQAIAREKQIKGWRRSKKVALIDSSKMAGGRNSMASVKTPPAPPGPSLTLGATP
jgi:putative endonuclease